MNNKKNENFYGINLNNLRKEYNDINNPKKPGATYSFWKNHIIYRIEGNEFIIENLLHHLINEERKKRSDIELWSSFKLPFFIFLSSIIYTFTTTFISINTDAINYIFSLFTDKNDINIEKISRTFTNINNYIIYLLVICTIVFFVAIGVPVFKLLFTRDKKLNEINFLRDFIDIIEKLEAKKEV